MIYETPLAVSKDTIKQDMDKILRHWTDGSKHIVSHYLSPTEFRQMASFTGNDHELVEWVRNFPHNVGAVYVVSDHNIVYDMNEIKPNLLFYRIVVRDDNTNIQKQKFNGS